MKTPPKILRAGTPQAYFSEIAEIYGSAHDVFLGNPCWTDEQNALAETLVSRYRARETVPAISSEKIAREGKIFIASGGSGGRLRFVAHTKKSLEASARALLEFLKLPAGTPLNCFACLPPWHVSGLMPFVRARVSGGKLFVAASGRFHADEPFPEFRASRGEFWMNSLVPTQLRRILSRDGGAEWLRKFDFILLGGARVPADLIAHASVENLKIGIGYGMTETASLVALWRAGDGEKIAGTPLPHAKISIDAASGRIAVAAESLGETLAENGELLPNPDGKFLTNDEGFFDENGRLVVLGRADRYINSGGEKIDPALVEAALVRAGTPSALVVGEADPEWGERVAAIVPAAGTPEDLETRVRKFLPPPMLPKRILRVPAMPFDEKGKLDQRALQTILAGK